MSESSEKRRQQLYDWLAKADQTYLEWQGKLAQTNEEQLRDRIKHLVEDIKAIEKLLVGLEAEAHPDLPDYAYRVYMQLAATHTQAKAHEIALESYKGALAIQPDPPTHFYLTRAELYLEMSLWRKALQDYKKLGEEAITARTLSGRAIAHFRLKEFGEAKKLFLQASELARQKSDITSQLTTLNYLAAIAHLEQNAADERSYYEAAIALFEQEGGNSADFSVILTNRAHQLRREGELEHALTNYNRAIELDGQNGNAYQGRALLYKKQGQLEEAATDFAKAIALLDGLAEPHQNLGNVLLLLGRYSEAKKEFEVAEGLGWRRHSLYEGLGVCALAEGDIDQAENLFTQAVKLKPKSAFGCSQLAGVYFAQGRTQDALTTYGQCLESGESGLIVEKAWGLALRQMLGETILAEEWQAALQAGGDEADYTPAEWKVGLALLSDQLPERRQEISPLAAGESNPLFRFYYQNGLKALDALAK